MFVLDRIKLLRMTKKRVDPPRDFSLDDFMCHSFKVMHDELYTVKARISPAWARWGGEKICHQSQKAKKNGDGSLELTFKVAGLDEIKRWVLSFGPEAVVLEPEKLEDFIREDLWNSFAIFSAPYLDKFTEGDSGSLNWDLL